MNQPYSSTCGVYDALVPLLKEEEQYLFVGQLIVTLTKNLLIETILL